MFMYVPAVFNPGPNDDIHAPLLVYHIEIYIYNYCKKEIIYFYFYMDP